MKIQYNREDDVLMVYLKEGKVDYAEEVGEMIVHYSKEHTPLFMEILDAAEFLANLTKAVTKAKSGEEVEV